MLRSHWCLGLALALVASPAGAQGDAGRTSNDESVSPRSALNEAIEPELAAAISRLASELEKGRLDNADPYVQERNERERRDILAQEGMADWAFPMFLAVLAQTLLALGALIALISDLRQNRKSSETQLRAYVSAKPQTLNSYRQNTRICATLEVKNDGATPAYKMRHGGNFLVATEEEAEQELRVTERPEIGKPALFTLQVGQTMYADIQRDHDLLPEEQKALRDGTKRLWLFGFTSYVDAFGYERTLRFCYYADGALFTDQTPPRGGALATKFNWVLAPFHNESN